ncbi:hypothetical protein H6G33_36400 [Calothrix sp. FACHB-1219]|uniref:hypothetical protein n=1 Tax=unclassified Calothrix TaxID=2619626 RepID=UPI001681DBA9|nr:MULTISPECIES: hypothetical protein [unclassified Calothrix]MBD2207794.1 hypothetical protein [Calothrix sp. FACHB-168]MBD2222414.1 hypothetical protein [Calothrix sp. FACHB-1219]
MLKDLINEGINNNKLFVELLLNFYLDGNGVERQRIEHILLENKNEQIGDYTDAADFDSALP